MVVEAFAEYPEEWQVVVQGEHPAPAMPAAQRPQNCFRARGVGAVNCHQVHGSLEFAGRNVRIVGCSLLVGRVFDFIPGDLAPDFSPDAAEFTVAIPNHTRPEGLGHSGFLSRSCGVVVADNLTAAERTVKLTQLAH